MRTGFVFAIALVLGLSSLASAQCMGFTSQSEFRQFVKAAGKFIKFTETFEESEIGFGEKVAIPAPLKNGVPAPTLPNGIAATNLCIQDNVTQGPNPDSVNPSGSPIALYVIAPGFIGSNSVKVGEDLEVLKGIEASLDLLFPAEDHKTGVSFELSHFDGFLGGDWHVTVYDENDVEIHKDIVADAIEPAKNFYGVWCPESITRINIWDVDLAPDAIDNIEMWQQLPTSVDESSWGVVKARYR